MAEMRSEKFYDTIIIGTGCAGYNAADWLYDLGHKNIAIITEGIFMGTSRNTGSDKQTYYKLSLASDGSDSVSEMAQTLFSGGCVNGDNAYIEAACSVKAFMKLVLLGVPFPTNEYGEYVGYKTDHDPRQRATSCGPLTSKLMTEALEKSVLSKGITVIDNTRAIKIITEDNTVTGLTTVDTVTGEYSVFACNNVILATGGPAAVYQNSVYPESQTGSLGLAIEAGAAMANLCEWQYGLASTKFRWNVSGTYQQVLPKYISKGPGGEVREFLLDAFENPGEALDMVFLKGYQWPFDFAKTGGSSRIDMLVHEETQRGNRVYMDYRENPSQLDYGELSAETRNYLENSNATFGTPIERLNKMNPAAIALYKNNGIDLYNEPLEIAVCAQHCNGGVAVDSNWESTIKGLYVAGEAAGTFGIYRPGGSALNSAQVGSMRAAEHIAGKESAPERMVTATVKDIEVSENSDSLEIIKHTGRAMSICAAFIRDKSLMRLLRDEIMELKRIYWKNMTVDSKENLHKLFSEYDTLITQEAVLSAMIFAADTVGSRGSAMVKGTVEQGDGSSVLPPPLEAERMNRPPVLPSPCLATDIIITENFISRTEPQRPLPEGGGWFETVWEAFKARKG